jgi:hypothetical protein
MSIVNKFRKAQTSIRYDQLPDDLQILLMQYIEQIPEDDDNVFEKLQQFTFPVTALPLSLFDSIQSDLESEIEVGPETGDDRGWDHVHDMVGATLPPIVMYGKDHLIDGKHRVAAAKLEGKTTIDAIDLYDFVSTVTHDPDRHLFNDGWAI